MKTKITSVFEIICWIATLAFCIFWIYKYSLNEDLCSIEFKSFYEDKKDAFPILSLCLVNPFSDSKLRRHKIPVDSSYSSYVKFLRGEEFNSTWLDVDYHSLIKNISDFIEQDRLGFRNGSLLHVHPDHNGSRYYQPHTDYTTNLGKVYSLAFFMGPRFYNCYGLSIPHDKNIDYFVFRVKNSIFKLGFRPEKYSLMTLLHYPNQMMYSTNTLRFAWPQKRSAKDSYIMRFRVSKVEILRRRYKERIPCIENWEEYDNLIVRNHINRIGCRPIYLNYSTENNAVSLCSTKEEMAQAKFELRSGGYGVSPPCTAMEEISYEYSESTFYSKGKRFYKEGIFWISMTFSNRLFKDIVQTKAINEQALVGNIGGYLGLFMGYSILQLPMMLHGFWKKLENWYLRLKSQGYPTQVLSFQSTTKEDAAKVCDKPEWFRQMENFGASIKSSLSKLDDKVELIQEKLLKLELRLQGQ